MYKKFVLGSFLCCAVVPFSSFCAQAPATPPAAQAKQYLFIVETSKSMGRRTHGVSEAVREILDSNLKSEFSRGDSLSVWTFSDEVQTNGFPVLKWSPETPTDVTALVNNFLNTTPFEKRASLDSIVPELNRFMSSSQLMTVILITTGENEIHGTALDGRLNPIYKRWEDEQKKARMPLVTVLRVKDRKIIAWTVAPAQWPLELPALPPVPPPPPPIAEPDLAPQKTIKPAIPPLKTMPSNSKPALAMNTGASLRPTRTAVPTNSTPSAAIVAIPRPAPTPKPITQNNPEVLDPAWKPFDQTLPEFLAQLSSAPSATDFSARSQSVLAKSQLSERTPSREVSQPKTSEDTPSADWKPFDQTLVEWLAAFPPAVESEPAKPAAASSPQVSVASEAPLPAVNSSSNQSAEIVAVKPASTVQQPATEPSPRPAGTSLVVVTSASVTTSEPQVNLARPQPEASKHERTFEAVSQPAKAPVPPPTAFGQTLTDWLRSDSDSSSTSADPKPEIRLAAAPAQNGSATTGHTLFEPIPRNEVRARTPSSERATASSAPVKADVRTEAAPPSAEQSLPIVGQAQPEFLRENLSFLCLMLLAAVATLFCFRNWLRSYLWPRLHRRDMHPVPEATSSKTPE